MKDYHNYKIHMFNMNKYKDYPMKNFQYLKFL